jgi:ABC-2 type transport system permease protein
LEQAARLIEPSVITEQILDPPSEDAARDADDRKIVARVATVLLFMAIALYANWVLMGVIEEKTSRVVEVLLAAVRATELVAGKVIGILLVALIQLGCGAIAAGVALMVFGGARIPDVAISVALVSCLYFVLGLLQYNLIYAVVGATVSRQSDASTATLPVALILLLPYSLSLSTIANNPDGLLARCLSLCPLTSPLTMPTRVAAGSPTLLELAVSLVLLLPMLAFLFWLAGQVYTRAILGGGFRVRPFILQAFGRAMR